MPWRRLVVLAALAACGDNRAAPRDAPPPPYPDAPPNDDAGPTIDFEEGPEPNGLGVLEASAAPAGIIPKLEPIGEALILHGHLAPFRDGDDDGELDPDVDTFTITTAAPALVRITVDGAGFRIHADLDQLALDRYGAATSREVYLPVAGKYQLSIAAAEVWIHALGVGPPAEPATGAYLVTIEQLVIPPATSTTSDAGMLAPGETRFYAPPLAAGLSRLSFTLDHPLARPALELVVDPTGSLPHVEALADHDRTVQIVTAAGDGALVVVEPLFDFAEMPLPFSFEVEASAAIALPTDGTTATIDQTSTSPGDLFNLPQFYLDLTTGLVSLDLAFDRPVRGGLFELSNFESPSIAFTSLAADAPTWQHYTGALRIPRSGRYVFVVYDPTGAPTLSATARSVKYPAVVGSDGSFDRVLTPGLPAAFRYQTSSHPLQGIDTFGSNTGGERFEFFEDLGDGGRVQPLVTSTGTLPGAFTPVWSYVDPEQETFHLRTLYDDGFTSFLVTVLPLSSGSDQSVSFTSYDETGIDLGSVSSASIVHSATIFPGNIPSYFLVHAVPFTSFSVAIDPPDLRVRRLDRYGNTVEDNPTTIVQDYLGWTPFSIDAATDPPAAIPFTVSFSPP